MNSGGTDFLLGSRKKRHTIKQVICLVDFESLIFRNNIYYSTTQNPNYNFNNYSFFENLIKSTSNLNIAFILFYNSSRCRAPIGDFIKILGNPQSVKTQLKQAEGLAFTIPSLKIKFEESYNSFDGIMYFQFSQPHLVRLISQRHEKFEYFDTQSDNVGFAKIKLASALCPVEVSNDILETIFLPLETNLANRNHKEIHTIRMLFSKFNYTNNWLIENSISLGSLSSFFQKHFYKNHNEFQEFYGSNFLWISGVSKSNKGNFTQIPEDIRRKIFNNIALSQLVYRE